MSTLAQPFAKKRRRTCVRIEPTTPQPEPIVMIGQGDTLRTLTGEEPAPRALTWICWIAGVPLVVWLCHWLDVREALGR
jgi:hypothetical protein